MRGGLFLSLFYKAGDGVKAVHAVQGFAKSFSDADFDDVTDSRRKSHALESFKLRPEVPARPAELNVDWQAYQRHVTDPGRCGSYGTSDRVRLGQMKVWSGAAHVS
jgi:hypothetical protein